MTTRNKPEFFDAVMALTPTSKFTVVDDEIQQFEPIDEKPTKEEVDNKLAELINNFDAQAYARKREAEYPSIQECVHAILDDQLDALQAKRAEIKKKYPKG